ncbi:hypothetical protein [Achromobacter xylosoxidans]|uniref:hypothetical protein n=1 Tax=Alcaligenes xylosoxydans xylosoxydans TaxID=85698 RepID=UPI0022B85F89|nr:hypothetical protein [Achromobacter xylosoxidans]MCZ8392085.1 hypothetical protein [Achromobacter xylosoxidans]
MKPSRPNAPLPQTSPTTPDPSREDQVDISARVQEGLKKANQRRASGERPSTTGHKATQFDGSPNPRPDADDNTLKPADDTPAVLPRRSGPKNPA